MQGYASFALISFECKQAKFLKHLDKYITNYINRKGIETSDLYSIKEFIQYLKFQKLLDRYDDLYSMDMFGESTDRHKYKIPHYAKISSIVMNLK